MPIQIKLTASLLSKWTKRRYKKKICHVNGRSLAAEQTHMPPLIEMYFWSGRQFDICLIICFTIHLQCHNMLPLCCVATFLGAKLYIRYIWFLAWVVLNTSITNCKSLQLSGEFCSLSQKIDINGHWMIVIESYIYCSKKMLSLLFFFGFTISSSLFGAHQTKLYEINANRIVKLSLVQCQLPNASVWSCAYD